MRFILALLILVCAVVVPAQQGPGIAKPAKEDVQKLATLEKNYKAAKATFEKKPKDAAAKKKFIEAAVKFGHESMMSPVLPTNVKYRQALRVYREVLKIDPNNKVAKPESELIIKIYQSMGRPVPDN